MKFLKFTVLIVAFLLLVACQQKGEEAVSPTVSAAKTPQVETRVVDVMVAITPEQPRRNECLQVMTDAYGEIRYEWYRNGQLLDGKILERLCDPEAEKRTLYQAVVVTETGRFSAEVEIANSPPQIEGVRVEPKRVIAGMPLTIVPVVRDLDGDEVFYRYQWYINSEPAIAETFATLSGDAYAKGDTLSVEIIPSDGEDEGPVFISGEMGIPNAPPRFLSAPPRNSSSRSYRYAAQAIDADGDNLTFSLEDGPEGMTVDPDTGLVTWEIPDSALDGRSHRVLLRVTDEGGAETDQEFSLNLPKR